MRSGIKMKYLVPALALLVLCTALLSLGDSRARTQTGVIWSGQLETLQTELTGEYLLSGGQRILMDDMSVSTSRQIPIEITADSGSTNGTLSCSVAYEDIYGAVLTPSQAYMHADLSTDATFVSVYEPKTITLTLTPTDYARQARGYEVVVTTTVTWTSSGGSTLSADFVTTLPTVEPGDVPDIGEPDPSETTGETGGTTVQTQETSAPTGSSETTAATTQATETNAATTQATETTAATTQATESQPEEPAAEAETGGDPQTDASPDTQSDTQAEEQSDTQSDADTLTDDPAQEPTRETVHVPVPTEPVTVTAGQSFSVSHMSSFDPEGCLAVIIALPTGSTGAKLTMADGSGFPAMTRYRIGDSGKPTLLLDGGTIELTGREDGVYELLLDFSATGSVWYDDVTVTPDAGAESETPTEPVTNRVYRNISVQITSLTTADTASVTASPSLTGLRRPELAPVLHDENELRLSAPETWGDCKLSYTLYRLETGESGTISYEIVDDPFAEGFDIVRNSDILSITTGSPSPIPGTYRLTLTWSYRGLTIHRVQYPFFVNLSGYALY